MGFTVLALAMGVLIIYMVIIFSKMRMEDARLLNDFHRFDLGFRNQNYVVLLPLAQIYNQMLRYQQESETSHYRIEILTPLEFIFHDYNETGLSFFHPYYRLTLDEARRGSLIKVSGKLRSELFFAVAISGLFLALLLGVKAGVIIVSSAFLLLTISMFFQHGLSKALPQLVQDIEENHLTQYPHDKDEGGSPFFMKGG